MKNISDQALAVAARRLMSSGKLSEAVIVESIREEIAEAEARLAVLRDTPRESGESWAEVAREEIARIKRSRPTKADKARAESRKLQGAYLALIRQFPKSKRAVFSRLAKEISRERAIRDMKRELKTPGSVIEKRKRPDRRKAPAKSNRPPKSSVKVRANEPRPMTRKPLAPSQPSATDAARFRRDEVPSVTA